ncbi:hypothetical protein PSAC2689_30396 [Paraburkholderia sacchari]
MMLRFLLREAFIGALRVRSAGEAAAILSSTPTGFLVVLMACRAMWYAQRRRLCVIMTPINGAHSPACFA